MSEILSRQSRLLDEGIGRCVQGREDGAESRWRLRRDASVQGLQTRSEHAQVHVGQEQRRAASVGRERVAELGRHATPEAFAGQAAQVMAHLARGVRGFGEAGQLRDHGPEPAVGDALRGARKPAEGPQERHRPRLPELQGGGGLPVDGLRGQHEIGELRPRQATVMGGLLGVQEAGVDVLPQRLEVAEITQPPSDPKVVGVVEGGLGAQGALLLKYCLIWQRLYATWTLGATPGVTTRVRNRPGVVRVIRRVNSSWTRLGRPRSRLSRMISSKNSRPRTGRSNTWVRLTSIWRIDNR